MNKKKMNTKLKIIIIIAAIPVALLFIQILVLVVKIIAPNSALAQFFDAIINLMV